MRFSRFPADPVSNGTRDDSLEPRDGIATVDSPVPIRVIVMHGMIRAMNVMSRLQSSVPRWYRNANADFENRPADARIQDADSLERRHCPFRPETLPLP